MHVRSMVTVAAAIATLALCIAGGAASANDLSVTNQRFRIAWTELEFQAESAEGTELSVICPVTLEGSFHQPSFFKTNGLLIGYVTRTGVRHESCRAGIGSGDLAFWNGSERILETIMANRLPWHVKYEGFTGTLPRITSMRMRITGIKFSLSDFVCLAVYGEPNTTIRGEFSTTPNEGQVTGFNFEANSVIPRTEGSGTGCPNPGRFFRTGTVTVLGTTAIINLRLI